MRTNFRCVCSCNNFLVQIQGGTLWPHMLFHHLSHRHTCRRQKTDDLVRDCYDLGVYCLPSKLFLSISTTHLLTLSNDVSLFQLPFFLMASARVGYGEGRGGEGFYINLKRAESIHAIHSNRFRRSFTSVSCNQKLDVITAFGHQFMCHVTLCRCFRAQCSINSKHRH